MKAGLGVNVIGVLTVLLALTTWGTPLLNLDTYPDWAPVVNSTGVWPSLWIFYKCGHLVFKLLGVPWRLLNCWQMYLLIWITWARLYDQLGLGNTTDWKLWVPWDVQFERHCLFICFCILSILIIFVINGLSPWFLLPFTFFEGFKETSKSETHRMFGVQFNSAIFIQNVLY